MLHLKVDGFLFRMLSGEAPMLAGTTRLAALLVLAAAALFPARLDAQGNAAPAARRPVPVPVPQVNGRNIVRHNGGLLMLPDWLTVETDAVDDPEENAQRGTGWRARISDAGFDRAVFPAFSDAEAARKELLARLAQDVDELSGKYGLTAAQKQRLHLAGRGDIKRMFDRVDDARRRLQAEVVDDIGGLQKLSARMSQESRVLRTGIRMGPFGEGSLFAKTLKNALTADQIAAYEQRKRDRPVVVTHSWDLRVR